MQEVIFLIILSQIGVYMFKVMQAHDDQPGDDQYKMMPIWH